MGRLLVFFALLAGAYMLIESNNGSIRLSGGSGGGGGGSGISNYTGASGSVVRGVTGGGG